MNLSQQRWRVLLMAKKSGIKRERTPLDTAVSKLKRLLKKKAKMENLDSEIETAQEAVREALDG